MKGSKLHSIMYNKCPICQEGDVFESKQVFNLKKFHKMPDRCTVCNHKFEIEAGFWYGAMYVSYGITVVLSILTFLVTYLIYPEASSWLYIGLITSLVLFLAPITYRYSRLIWMNMFSTYDALKTKNIHE